MEPIRVRTVRPEERASAEEVGRRAFASVRSVYHPKPSAVGEVRDGASEETMLVGLLGEQVVAVVAYRVEGDALLLRGLGVLPDHRRCGWARRLVETLLAPARRAGCSCLRLHTIRETGNVLVFERLGFRVTEEAVATWCESPSGGVLYEATLERSLARGGRGAPPCGGP